MNVDCKNSNEYIRLFTDYGFKISNTVSKYNEDEADYITMQELQAINKKCEELGWI